MFLNHISDQSVSREHENAKGIYVDRGPQIDADLLQAKVRVFTWSTSAEMQSEGYKRITQFLQWAYFSQ